MKKIISFVFAVSITISMVSCVTIGGGQASPDNNENAVAPVTEKTPATTEISDSEKLALVENYIDTLLTAVKTDDYVGYFKNFVHEHKTEIKESDFKEKNKKLYEQCGEYQSRQFLGIVKKQIFDVYLWKAKYSKIPKDDIVLRLFITDIDGQIKIYGFNIQPF